MRKIDEIIIHCTATPEGRDFTVRQIDKWHRHRGFDGIGYHFVVYRDGSVHNGRPVARVGAHCKGHNANSIGVCYVGGLAADGKTPKDTRTPLQKVGLLRIIRQLLAYYPSIKSIHGHCDYAAKACPCFDAHKEYAEEVARRK